MTNQLYGVKEDLWKPKIPLSKPAYETSVMLKNQQISFFSTKSSYIQVNITLLEIVSTRPNQVENNFLEL